MQHEQMDGTDHQPGHGKRHGADAGLAQPQDVGRGARRSLRAEYGFRGLMCRLLAAARGRPGGARVSFEVQLAGLLASFEKAGQAR